MKNIALLIQFIILLLINSAGVADKQLTLDMLNYKTETYSQSCQITVEINDTMYLPQNQNGIGKIVLKTLDVAKPYRLSVKNVNSDFPNEKKTGFRIEKAAVKDSKFEYEIKSPIPDGTYYVHVEIEDAFGNILKADSEPYTINYAAAFNHTNIHCGDLLRFGHYPGTNESIKWIVLEIRAKYALLLCEDLVYDTYTYSIRWDESNRIRNLLNDVFLSEAFSDDEKNAIKRVTVTTNNHVRPRNLDMDSENVKKDIDSSYDDVFLLSIEEIDKYEEVLEDHMICRLHDNGAEEGWWIRGHYNGTPYIINEKGQFEYMYHHMFPRKGVRPALWIRYDMVEFDRTE